MHPDSHLEPLQKHIPIGDDQILTLIWCPPGEFIMGNSGPDTEPYHNDKPNHKVIIEQGFWIGQTPLTQEQWLLHGEAAELLSGRGVDLAAEGMSFEKAEVYCALLTTYCRQTGVLNATQCFDMLWEEEWEYACRAGTTTPWHFGEDTGALDAHAWYKDNSGNSVHPVGLKLPNPWGLYDVYGNVSEWCRTHFYNYRWKIEGKQEPSDRRVGRGGSCTDRATECTSSSRFWIDRNVYNDPIGFRIACREGAK